MLGALPYTGFRCSSMGTRHEAGVIETPVWYEAKANPFILAWGHAQLHGNANESATRTIDGAFKTLSGDAAYASITIGLSKLSLIAWSN